MFRPERFIKQLRIVTNHRISRLQNAGTRTVILFQFNDAQIWKINLQSREVFYRRAAPSVNRLIIITHRGEHRFFADARDQ